MNTNSEAIKIVNDLFNEFKRNEQDLKNQYNDNMSEIENIESNISIQEKNEDIDFKVFSPRNINSTSREKIKGLSNKKDEIEKSNKEIQKQIKYYSEKSGKLERLLFILNSNSTNAESYISDEETVESELSNSTNTDNNGQTSINELFPESILFADLSKFDVIEDKIEINDNSVSESLDINEDNKNDNVEILDNNISTVTIDTEENEGILKQRYFDIESIIHKLSLCLKFIDIDPKRAKDDLRTVIKLLQN